MTDWNKNDKQLFFNQTKGKLVELNQEDKFCNITIEVGTENKRHVNIVVKPADFIEIIKKFNINDMVCVKHYPVSRKVKETKWYTLLNLINIDKLN